MKKLTTLAFVAVMTLGVAANAGSLRNEGMQNFFYYFGTPCHSYTAPCGVAEPMCAPVAPMCAPMCCDDSTGLFGIGFMGL